MARASLHILSILRNTIKRLETSEHYQWGHMGSCNCGFLAQEITHLKKEDIHSRAMQGHGDWTEQLNDYCPTSKLPLDDIIDNMIACGFDRDDLRHLERLSSPTILKLLPATQRVLRYNRKEDVMIYLKVWADDIEKRLIEEVAFSDLDLDAARPITDLSADKKVYSLSVDYSD